MRNLFLILLVCGLLSIGVFVTSSTHASFVYQPTQDKVEIQRDLAKFFKKSNLVWFDSIRTERGVRQNSKLSFTAGGKTWDIDLIPNDLRAKGYRAEKSVDGNARVPIEMEEINTYKGNISGLTNAEARFTIDEEKIQGVIFTQGERFYLEPARRYSNKAANTDYVFYSESDLINKEIGSCPAGGLHDTVEMAVQEYLPQAVQQSTESVSALRVADLATEADNEYVAAFGGSAQANNSILSILNVVQGVYERELNLHLRVVYQHTWEAPDPYSGTDPNTILVQFRDYWNANFTNINRDISHLWTGRTMNGGIVGYAYIGIACNSPVNSYGVSMKFDYEPNKFYITAHEIAHNFGAQHADGQSGCYHTIMESSIHFEANSFCQISRDQIAAHIAANPGCLSFGLSKTRFDFDGDNRADTTVYRPAGGLWYTQNSSDFSIKVTQFGLAEDKPMPEDFDGDGKADVAVWRPSNGVWYILNSSDNSFRAVNFGLSTDIPVPADFEGDGKADLVVFRPSTGTWYFMGSRDGFSARAFGILGDIPVSSDYDGDGRADTAVFRPSTGVWYVQNSSNGSYTIQPFGMLGDKPVGGDFDGDGRADLSVFRPSTNVWYNLFSSSGSFRAVYFGMAGDQLTAADYDGDGKTDISVFRPSTGIWYFNFSSNNSFGARQFGMLGDIAAPSVYVQ